MPQPQPFGDSATSADPLNGSTGKVVSAQKEYDDAKEDDSFLNEVEDSLLDHPAKTSSRQTLMTRKDENNNDEVNYSTGSETLFSTTNSPSAIAVPVNPFGDDKYSSHSQYGFHHHDSSSSSNASTPPSQLDDPSSFRRKVRAAIFYLLCSTLHEIIIYKISQRTTWSNVTLFIPFELLISTTIAGLVTIYMKKSSNLKLQYAIGLDGSPILPSIAWKDSAPLAGFTVTAAVFRILKDAHLEASISTALSTYIAPALCIILPILYLNKELPRNGFLILASITIPTFYGLAITGLRVSTSAIFFSLMFVFVEAGKLALAKKWFLRKGGSPLDAIFQYLPPATLLALLLIAPISATIGKENPFPRFWKVYFISHLITSILNQISTLVTINVFNSPISVALLSIPKGLLVTIIHGGISINHQRASHSIFVTFGISTLILCVSIPELKSRLTGDKIGDKSHLPSSYISKAKTGESLQESPSGAYISARGVRFLALASFTPILYWFISQVASNPIDLNSRLQFLQYYTHSPTVDIVISYYDEELDKVHATIQNLRYYPWIKFQDPRFIIYTKAAEENNTMSDEEFLDKTGADRVYHLKNRGRESGTYLRHILRNYNQSIDPTLAQGYRPAGLADYTIFMQPHLAWDWIAKERLWLFQKNTGYLHFAPYLKLDCGKDMNGNGDFIRLREIYSIFTEELCPPTLQLGAYSSQFVVSKKRILANPYHKYKSIDDVLEAEADHWIHTEGTWWKYHGEPGPTNPYFGHAMERAWPTIFGCTDPNISDTCAGDNYNITGCQCFD